MTVQSIRDLTSFKWGTLTAVNPLAVKLDGDSAALALIPDSLIDPSTLSVGTRVRVELSLRKVVIHGAANGSGGSIPGEVKLTAASAAPVGWLLCQGQSLLRAQYPGLFSAIGTTYGAADSTRFNLPDLRGRVAVGRDAAQPEFDVLGEASGAKTHTLTVAEMPSHSHGQNVSAGASPGPAIRRDWAGDGNGASYPQGISTDSAGGGGAHNNLQPYITLNYIIKI